jgi:tRNA 2-selenouridine synthase
MVREISIDEFLTLNLPLVDVRSPGEFLKGHIPGAVSIPLFTDAERAQVGTLYKQVSAERAMEAGLRYVHPKLDDYILHSNKAAPDGYIAVHCWRGGMRSRAFAGHLSDNGFKEVYVITGGYKAFRNHVLSYFDTPFRLWIIGGYTGSGKTDILQYLSESGQQTVNLEGLAHHKGSSFGAMGQEEQPTSEQFENNLFEVFRKLDSNLPIWLEDESHNIGGVNIPINLYTQMKKNPVFFLDIPKEKRALRLLEEYASFEPELIGDAIRRISKRLGGQHTKSALQFLEEQNFYDLAMIVLTYYDKSYRKGLQFHDSDQVYTISLNETDPIENAKVILKKYETISGCKVDAV